MPGLPSTVSDTESPTGCTKQLINVACRGIDAPAGDEAALERLVEHRLPARRVFFNRGQRARDAPAHRFDRRFVSLGVFLQQHVERDLLRGEGELGVGELHNESVTSDW
jgi:hypothetical protein